jgi:hypothetical protein
MGHVEHDPEELPGMFAEGERPVENAQRIEHAR